MPPDVGKKAILFEQLPKDMVKCTACSHYCTIPDGKTGICGVRKNHGGHLYLLVYGKPCAVHLDPIEKKPLFHVLPGTPIFSVGTFGCNFKCDFCQNWDISQNRSISQNSQASPLDSSIVLPPEKIIEHCLKNKIPSIAFTYNEPAIFFEYAFDTMKLAKKENIKTIFVSNGYSSLESLEKMSGYLDAINIDLKSFSSVFYQKLCNARLEPVLENIKRIKEKGIWVEITTLIIPKENDSSSELEDIASFIASVDQNIPWHITAFHPDYRMAHHPETPPEKLKEAYEIGKKKGLKFIYVGNIHDPDRQNTICPQCSNLLVRRSWHLTEIVGMQSGLCNSCKTKIPGIWQ